jgi:hypothetical protein
MNKELSGLMTDKNKLIYSEKSVHCYIFCPVDEPGCHR